MLPFSALAHLLHKSTSCCHDGWRFYTNAISTFRFVYHLHRLPCSCSIFTYVLCILLIHKQAIMRDISIVHIFMRLNCIHTNSVSIYWRIPGLPTLTALPQVSRFQYKSHSLTTTQGKLTGSPFHYVNIYRCRSNGASYADFLSPGKNAVWC